MRAAERFFAEAIAVFGIEEGGVVRIPMTQCELARRQRVAASTVGSYLSAMGSRVVQRTPQIVLNADEAPAPAREDGGDLLDAFRVLAAAQARVIELLAAPASAARGSRGSVRGFREISRDEVQEDKEEDLLPSLELREQVREPRADRADWTDDDLDVVLAPLHRAVSLAGAKPMNNRPQLLAALRPFAIAQIETAVAELVTAVNCRNSTVRSPFGMLVTRARTGTMPTVQSPRAADQSASGPAVAESVIPVEVRQAVDALSPADRDGLDAFIDDEIGRCTYRAPAMTNALRLEYFDIWRTTHRPDGHHGDTVRTTPAHPEHTPSMTGAHQ